MSAITSAEDRERLQRIWRSAAYGATPKDLLWLTQQTVRLLEERDRLKALDQLSAKENAVSSQPSALSPKAGTNGNGERPMPPRKMRPKKSVSVRQRTAKPKRASL